MTAETPDERELALRILQKFNGQSESEVTVFDAAEVAALKRVMLSKEEAEALKKILQFWLGIVAVGRGATVLKSVVTYVGWAVGVYMAIKYGLADFVAGAKPWQH